jgi:lipopolysaccharide exporter
MIGLAGKMAKGAAWMVLLRLSERLLGLVSTLVLARLLVPEDFGLVALAASLLGMLEIMGAFGFELALIHNQRAERRHYDTAWTLGLIYGAFSALVLSALAGPAARFFDDSRLEGVLYVFAGCAIAQSCKNIGVVAFQKELDFRREFAFVLIRKFVAVSLTLALAFIWRTYWALALGSLASVLLGAVLSYRMHPFRPKLALSGWRTLMGFSGWVLFSNVVVFAGNRGYELVIARIAGMQSLGLYAVAYEISNLPTTELVWPVSKAVFPGFSRLASNLEKLREAFLNTTGMVALIAIPAGAGVTVLAVPLVEVLLGTKWLDAVPLIQILAIFGTLRALHAGTGAVYLALGMTRLIAWIATPHVVIGLPTAALLLMRYDLRAATIGILAAGIVALAMSLAIVRRILHLHFVDLVSRFWRPLLATMVMVLIELALLTRVSATSTIELVGWLLFLVATGALVYALSLLVLWWGTGKPAGIESILIGRLRVLRAGKAA